MTSDQGKGVCQSAELASATTALRVTDGVEEGYGIGSKRRGPA
jgi:hypothetical protein